MHWSRRPAPPRFTARPVPVVVATASGGLAATVVLRRHRRTEPDDLDGFPAHRALRRQLSDVLPSLTRRTAVRRRWVADGRPILGSEDLQIANEALTAKALELRDVAEALKPLL